MMPFLGLVATQRGKYDYYSKSCGRSYLPYYSIRVSLVLNLSKCGQVSHELMKASITLLALYRNGLIGGLVNILGAVR